MSFAESNPFLGGDKKVEPQPQLAVVTAVLTGGVKLRIGAETEARQKLYKRIASYTPAVGDRVYIVKMSGTYIVIGKVV